MTTLLQTQFLKQYITLQSKQIPISGPLAGVSVSPSWFTIVDYNGSEPIIKITKEGIKAFWVGVKKWGRKVLDKPIGISGPNNTPPSGGTPIAMTA